MRWAGWNTRARLGGDCPRRRALRGREKRERGGRQAPPEAIGPLQTPSLPLPSFVMPRIRYQLIGKASAKTHPISTRQEELEFRDHSRKSPAPMSSGSVKFLRRVDRPLVYSPSGALALRGLICGILFPGPFRPVASFWMAHALLVDGVQGYIYYANTCSDRHGARCKGSSAEIRETRSQPDARDDRIRSRRPSKGGWPCEPQPDPCDPRRLGPFHDASEPECRGELPRGPRHDRRRKQRIDLGP